MSAIDFAMIRDWAETIVRAARRAEKDAADEYRSVGVSLRVANEECERLQEWVFAACEVLDRYTGSFRATETAVSARMAERKAEREAQEEAAHVAFEKATQDVYAVAAQDEGRDEYAEDEGEES